MASTTSTGAYFLTVYLQNSITRKQHQEEELAPHFIISSFTISSFTFLSHSLLPSSYDPSQTTLFLPKPCDACSVALTISDIPASYEPQMQRPCHTGCSWREARATNVVTSWLIWMPRLPIYLHGHDGLHTPAAFNNNEQLKFSCPASRSNSCTHSSYTGDGSWRPCQLQLGGRGWEWRLLINDQCLWL